MGPGGLGVSVSNGGKLPPRKFLGNSTTSRGHSGGAGSRGRSESATLGRTSRDEGELGGTGWRAVSASPWDGATKCNLLNVLTKCLLKFIYEMQKKKKHADKNI